MDTAAETPTGTAEDGAYLFFDPSVPGFVWSTIAGTYDAALGGIYDASDRRQCRFRLTGATTFDILVAPVASRAAFDGDVGIDGTLDVPTVNTGQGDNELYAMNQDVESTDVPTFAGITLNGSIAPETTPSDGQTTVSSGSTWTPSRGVYMVTTSNNLAFLRIYVNDSWRTESEPFAGGCLITDGSNVRLFITGSSSTTIYYLKY